MRHNFRELVIWRMSIDMTEKIYKLTESLPQHEKFGLTSQIRRSSVSIPSNIAEGSGRTSDKEFRHFLNIGISSSYELETQLELITKIYQLETTQLLLELNKLQKMIGGFKRSLA